MALRHQLPAPADVGGGGHGEVHEVGLGGAVGLPKGEGEGWARDWLDYSLSKRKRYLLGVRTQHHPHPVGGVPCAGIGMASGMITMASSLSLLS